MLILASGSPRRRELLGRHGVPFQVVVSGAAEAINPVGSPEGQAVAVARRKVQAAAAEHDFGQVLGADTIVVLDGEMLGKPRDDLDATRMLRALSGQEHQVVTGVVLVDAASGEERSCAVASTVRFRSLNDGEIASYVASGEPHDKAGAYAIQGCGAAPIDSFFGCFTNIVGLPLCETARLFTEAGLTVPAAAPVCRLPDGSPCPRLV